MVMTVSLNKPNPSSDLRKLKSLETNAYKARFDKRSNSIKIYDTSRYGRAARAVKAIFNNTPLLETEKLAAEKIVKYLEENRNVLEQFPYSLKQVNELPILKKYSSICLEIQKKAVASRTHSPTNSSSSALSNSELDLESIHSLES